MQLREQDIQFINNYLKNSGVEFLDIRLEMTDHVASALEQKLENQPNLSFYDAFKNYMIQHKKSLLKNARKQRWAVDSKVLKRLKSSLFSRPVLLGAAGFAAILTYLNTALINDFSFKIAFLVIISSAIALPYILFYKLKISFLDRLAIYSLLFNYLFYRLVDYLELLQTSQMLTYSLIIWINLAVVRTAFKMSHFYKNQYASL